MIFKKQDDFAAFERVLAEAVARSAGDVRILAYCVMGNHWHLVVRTTRNGALSPFMQWITLTHTQRYRVAHGSVGDGPLYQGRFKSFLIEQDNHFLTVARYVERNAARAGLVERAEDWRWCSLWRSRLGHAVQDEDPPLTLTAWPVTGGRPRQWLRTVNTPLNQSELQAMRQAAQRGSPHGNNAWRERVVQQFGLQGTLRQPGRPKRCK